MRYPSLPHFAGVVSRSLIFLAGLSSLHATTLVAIWTPQRLLLGADSRVLDDGMHPLADACKITQAGSAYYAVAGLAEDPVTGYRVDPLAQQAFSPEKTIADQLTAFVQLVHLPLQKAVNQIKLDSPDQYRYLQQGHPVLQVIFAGRAAKGPALAVAGFQVDPEGGIQEYSKVIADGSDGSGASRIIYAGQQGHVREYLASHRDWADGDGATLVNNLIQSEIEGGSGIVGGPIDIIAVNADGASWVQQKAGCDTLPRRVASNPPVIMK